MISRTAVTRLALTLAAFAMLSLAAACGPAQAIYGTSVGIGDAINIKRDIARDGDLSAQDERVVTQDLLDGNSALLQVTDTAECFTEYTSDTKQKVLRGLGDAITSLDNLNQSGSLRIKSENARKRFKEKIRYAKIAASGIRTTLAIIRANDPASTSQPMLSEDDKRKLDELRALCRKAGEQLRENDRRLREDLKRLASST